MRMNVLLTIGLLAFGLATGCTKKEPEHATPPAPTAETPSAPAPIAAVAPLAATAEQKPDPTPASVAPAMPTAAPSPVPAAPVSAPKTAPAAAPAANSGLDLAKRSGCLACHSVEKKVVGPAWNDVSARYAGDATVKSKLVAKVKAGGKGNWVDVTGGAVMPPYSPRVSDADIEALVEFILGLKAK